MVIVAAAALCIKVSKESVVSNELFEENVEALTRVEKDYQKKEWIVYEHGNGDFNCTKGGTRSCRFHMFLFVKKILCLPI